MNAQCVKTSGITMIATRNRHTTLCIKGCSVLADCARNVIKAKWTPYVHVVLAQNVPTYQMNEDPHIFCLVMLCQLYAHVLIANSSFTVNVAVGRMIWTNCNKYLM